ncbi:hypothetical protein PTKIN_Ptkin03bG0109100 [Pterospermum kingtungense]
MWRSITSRSGQVVAREFCATQMNQPDSFAFGNETNAMEVPSVEGFVGDETQIDGFFPGLARNDMEEETQVYEIDGNKLENVLSLLQSRADESL